MPVSVIEPDIFNQNVPRCPVCPEEADGILKPSITFFGEKLPDAFDNAFAEDREKVDLLIVMGSSLKVSPVADVKGTAALTHDLDKIPHHIPQILINMEALPHMSGFDVQLLGYCDTVVTELCRMLDWDLKHDKIPGHSSLALREEVYEEIVGEDGEILRQKKDVYTQGTLPHRYLFEGGLERLVYESSCSSSSEPDSSDESSGGDSVDDEDEPVQMADLEDVDALPFVSSEAVGEESIENQDQDSNGQIANQDQNSTEAIADQDATQHTTTSFLVKP